MTSILQAQSILDRFTVDVRNGRVYLNWVISKGNTCNGIDVERSVDGANFTSIHNIEGICGSQDSATTYFYTDDAPLPNMTNFYRLKLGSVAYSEVRPVEVIGLNQNGYHIRPHPVIGQARIYFRNELMAPHHISIFNLNGEVVMEKSVSNNYFEISNNQMASGMYFFTIKMEDKNAINGKVLVRR